MVEDAASRAISAAMAAFEPAFPLAVALSGGADSTALLVACAQKWPGRIRAIHVHHGLQSAADGFAIHCEGLCQRFGVPLDVRRVQAAAAPGQSPEDAARRARYEAFDAVASAQTSQTAIKSIALAQHADDQAETLLLALSRGAGLPGLAAMPARWQRGDVVFYRPLLTLPGPMLRQWLMEQGIAWVDDPSNRDERFTRNRIRGGLMPALAAVFPQYRETFARSARHAAEAQALLVDLAQADLARAGCPPEIAALQTLSRARQGNLIRHWLATLHRVAPSTAQLDQLLSQVAACTTRGHRIELKIASGQVLRRGALLAYLDGALPPPEA